MINVFISHPTPFNKYQEGFLSLIEFKLKEHGLNPTNLGKNNWSFRSPLKPIKEIMDTCVAAIVIGLERHHSFIGYEKESSVDSKELIHKYSSSPWIQIEAGMKSSIQENNHQNLLKYSSSILEWGGVKRSNYVRLEDMEESIVQYYKTTIRRLNPETVNTDDDFSDIIMNSGFTKIYSLLIDDFVIYDSRVGAALGLLIKKFLEDKNIEQIPEVLTFAYGNARQTKNDKGPLNRRNPSSKKYIFPILNNNDKKHIKNNLYANWLLKEISEKSKFKEEISPIRSLESAFFMIGYAVN